MVREPSWKQVRILPMVIIKCSSLIPECKGMHPLYQQQPKKVTITWRFLKHHHHNNEFNVDNNHKNNVKNTASATRTQERSISSPHSKKSGIQYHQLSNILFFSNPSQPNHSGLLRTTMCGILLNDRITAF